MKKIFNKRNLVIAIIVWLVLQATVIPAWNRYQYKLWCEELRLNLIEQARQPSMWQIELEERNKLYKRILHKGE